MKNKFALMILLMLAGCGSLPKTDRQAALYDFGIPSDVTPLVLPIRLAEVQSAPGLEGSEIRYRLAYKNPAQVFSYTESLWVASPDKLLNRRMAQRLHGAGTISCTLRVTVEVFDQVFDTPSGSRGIVQLRAELLTGTGREAVAQSTLVKAERPATSADAQGGVAALDGAAGEALEGVLSWAAERGCK